MMGIDPGGAGVERGLLKSVIEIRISEMKTLDYRTKDSPAPSRPTGHRLPRFVVEGIFFLILTPIFCVIDGSLVVYLALSVPSGRAWIVRMLTYPGVLFSNDDYTVFAINGVCWSFAVILLIECLIQFFQSCRAKAPKNSD